MTVPQSLGKVEGFARRTQAAGFSGLLFTETGRTAYLNAAVASQAAPGLELSTGVAVAFPRSPFVTAATAWELQEATDPKVDVAAVNPWMLRMAGEVADGVHVHPLGEPGYLARHVVPNVAEGAAKSGRSASDIALIVPVMTIVGDSDEERHKERELARVSMSFYGSTPNYAFIWDEAGFEGTTARIREEQKAGDFKAMAAQITDDHIATFATESTWDDLADALIDKHEGIATRIVLYNALGDQERFERYGAVARRISTPDPRPGRPHPAASALSKPH